MFNPAFPKIKFNFSLCTKCIIVMDSQALPSLADAGCAVGPCVGNGAGSDGGLEPIKMSLKYCL